MLQQEGGAAMLRVRWRRGPTWRRVSTPSWRMPRSALSPALSSTACAAACAGADGAQTQRANSTEESIAFTRPRASILTWAGNGSRSRAALATIFAAAAARVQPPPLPAAAAAPGAALAPACLPPALSCPHPKLVCDCFPGSRNYTRRGSVCGPGHPRGTLATMMAADLGSGIRQLIAQVELQGRAGGYATAEADLQQLRSMLQAWEAYRAKQAKQCVEAFGAAVQHDAPILNPAGDPAFSRYLAQVR